MLVSCTTCRISTGRYITLYCVFKYFVQERELAIQRCSFTLKLSVKKLIRNEVARCPPASLRKKTLSHILIHVFCLQFLRAQHDFFFLKCFESVRAQFPSGSMSKKECYL